MFFPLGCLAISVVDPTHDSGKICVRGVPLDHGYVGVLLEMVHQGRRGMCGLVGSATISR